MDKKIISLILTLCITVASLFIVVGCGTSNNANPASDFKYLIGQDHITISKYIGNVKDVIIPNKIEGKSVTEIGNEAFKEIDWITSVEIPNSVTTIGDWAFYNCISLTNVTIPDSVIIIGSGAFYKCSLLLDETIARIKQINSDAMWD